ncbi:MAG: FAD-dependent oxidoreductase [Alphaproteobacteria bacterium]|nr:FAD-dependent oxidoreductase [Alphaproteobacteria bacterium]
MLPDIAISPGVSAGKKTAMRSPHAGSGSKIFAELEGDTGNLSILAPQSRPIVWLATQRHAPEGSLVILFSTRPNRLDPADRDEIQRQLTEILPQARIRAIAATDWAADPFSKGSWCALQPGRTREVVPALARPEGRIHFASADTAQGWRGFVDGAIESGLRAAREIGETLR